MAAAAALLEVDNTIPAILDGKFFKIQTINGNKVVAKCLKCAPAKSISGCLNATSNFVTHLSRVHPSLVSKYEEHKNAADQSKRQKRKISDDERPGGSTDHNRKQLKIAHCRQQVVPQEKVDKLIMNFIVGDMCSLRMVETQEFKDLVIGLAPNSTVMTRKTLSRRLTEQHGIVLEKLKNKLALTTYVCATADAWSADGRGYLGVTAHWIDCDTLVRHSAALACRRLRGSHTYDVLADVLNQIFADFGLNSQSGKLICCITDNGSNFTKAFREFGLEYGNDDSGESDEEDGDNITEELKNMPISIQAALNAEPENNSFIYLPPHHPCTAHTLSLIAVTDSQNALKDNAAFKRIHNSTLAKCSAIWNACSRSLRNCEAVDGIVGRRLTKPCPTRWNSLYDSLTVLQTIRADIKTICQTVGVAIFKDQELDFIDEYLTVLRPIAMALDRLQGDKMESMSFMGALLPTLITVHQKLTDLTHSTSLVYCKPLANAVLNGVQCRFGHLISMDLSANDYIIAAVSHPFFKLRWVPTEHLERCRLLFIKARIVNNTNQQNSTEGNSSTVSSVTSSIHNDSEDDFFAFTSLSGTHSGNEESTLQVSLPVIHSSQLSVQFI